MAYDTKLLAAKLRRWETYLNNYQLPQWNDLPDLGLYMEQVIILLKQYLDYLPPELKEEQFITAATINNYVRTKVMPEPIKKRYYRNHIAYLIIILTLKQSLSIAMIKTLIPLDMSTEELESFYKNYVSRHQMTAKYFTEEVRMCAGMMLGHDQYNELASNHPEDIIISSAIVGGFTRLLAEKIILLADQTYDSVMDSNPESLKKED